MKMHGCIHVQHIILSWGGLRPQDPPIGRPSASLTGKEHVDGSIYVVIDPWHVRGASNMLIDPWSCPWS